MKVLAVLCLLGLVAAEPQVLLPYNARTLLTPTIKTEGGVINTYTATYPYGGLPLVRAALPYSWNLHHPYSIPTVLAAKPVETTRQKRDADPEPAINFPTLRTAATPAATIPATVATIPSTLATIPTTYNYQYPGLPAAVSTYSVPQTLPLTGVSPFVGTYPFTTGLTTPYTTGLTTPYTAGWPWTHPFVTTIKAETPKEEGVTRAKRSADPEADPQLLTTTTGVTGFSYPAINTGLTGAVVPSTYTGAVVPSTYTGAYNTLPVTYPTRYTTGWTGLTGLTTGFPYNTFGTTVYG